MLLLTLAACMGGGGTGSTGIVTISDTAAFRVVDDVVSDPGDSLTDPEFDANSMRITWSPREGGPLWVADIDPATGDILPLDGRGFAIDQPVEPHGTFANGPEWIVWNEGSGILYTKRRGDVPWVTLALLDPSSGAWQRRAIVRGGAGRGSLDPTDTDPHLIFDQDRSMHWVDLFMTEGGQLSPERQRFQTWWVGGEPRALWSGPSADATAQMMETEVHTGVTTQLTASADHHHVDGAVWFSPLLGKELMFAVSLNLQYVPEEIVVFEEKRGKWTPIKRISSRDLTSLRRFVISPEVFVFGGKSYVSFLLSTATTNSQNGYAQVWVAGLEPGNTFLRQVSGETMMVRKDPEVLVTPSRVWVYYTEVDDQGSRLLHRCESGL